VQIVAAGIQALDLAPEVEGEGKTWRFIGLQSKNRAEWYTTHLANMFIGATTIAFYDTLGDHAQRYIVKQTQVATIFCAGDIVAKLAHLKEIDVSESEDERKMDTLKTIVSFDPVPSDAKSKAEGLGMKVITWDELLKAGEGHL
jgi:long-subunit acyl-CoA synthetase (AMP-forming)